MALSTKRPSEKTRLLDEVRETAVGTKRLNIDVEATLYRRMKTQAVKEDRTLSDITRQLWAEYLSKYASE